jgi:hypothetical protein
MEQNQSKTTNYPSEESLSKGISHIRLSTLEPAKVLLQKMRDLEYHKLPENKKKLDKQEKFVRSIEWMIDNMILERSMNIELEEKHKEEIDSIQKRNRGLAEDLLQAKKDGFLVIESKEGKLELTRIYKELKA